MDGRKEVWEEVVCLVHLDVEGLGGESGLSEMQEEGEEDLPLIHQTLDDSSEWKGAAPVMMTALVGAAVAAEVVGQALGVDQPEVVVAG